MKTPKLTPWQKWAQDYMAKRETNTGQPPFYNMDNEEADHYARAAWNECKKRAIEIVSRHKIVWGTKGTPHIPATSLEVLKEIRKL